MKKLLSLVLTAAMLSMLVGGCTKTDTAESTTTKTEETATEEKEVAGDEEYHLGICVHSLDNEFWAQEADGAKLFASQTDDLKYDVLTCDSDDNKQLQGIKDYIAKYGDKAMFVVDPASAAVTANIVETCQAAGCYVAIAAHRSEGLFPADFDSFVIHMAQSDQEAGYKIACGLFEAMGGKGKVAELQGQLGNDAAAARHKGFEQALEEYPDIECVESEVADWDQQIAMTDTEQWLTKHEDLAGVFCANDTMALGAIEALKSVGLNGTVKVCGCDGISAAYDAIKAGDLVCTIANDGYMIMGYAASYVYQATKGELDPTSIPDEERLIYTKTAYIDEANVDEMVARYITGTPDYDFSDLSYCVAGYQDVTK